MTIEFFFAEDPTSDVFSPNGPLACVVCVDGLHGGEVP